METLKLLQFRAAYNLPVHAGIETGIFARHGLTLEIAYTPGSLHTTQALTDGRFDIGHTGADDVIAAVEAQDRADLFLFMGRHSGLFSLVAAPVVASIDGLTASSALMPITAASSSCLKGYSAPEVLIERISS